MTLNGGRSSETQHIELGSLPLVVKPGKPPRLPLWYWLRYPIRARLITLLIREAFRWRDHQRTEPSALTNAEAAVLRPAQRALRRQVDDVVKRLDELADRYQELQARSARERRMAKEEGERTYFVRSDIHLYSSGPLTATQARQVVDKCRERIQQDTEQGQTRHLDSSSWGVMAMIPLFVDIVALATVILKFFNITSVEAAFKKIPETVTAVGFSVIAAFVLAVLAHSAGSDAWRLRAVTRGDPAAARPRAQGDESDEDQPPEAGNEGGKEFPPPRRLLFVKLISLAVVSAMVAVSIATRVIQPTPDTHTGWLGVMIGVLLGVVVFLAPWAVVWNRLQAGSLEVGAINDLTEMMREAEAAVSGHAKASDEASAKADTVRHEAERTQRDGVRAAHGLTDTTRGIIDLARSHHGQNGLLAINDDVTPGQPYVALREMLATSTAAIDEAMKRFQSPDEGKQ